MATRQKTDIEHLNECIEMRFLSDGQWQKMIFFEKDILMPDEIEVNRMDNARLLRYFLEDWDKWRKEFGTK